MPNVTHEIEVEAPLSTVYNQWTQFEEFPRFMEGVTEVRQIDARRLAWKAEIAGNTAEWEAEIDRQEPDEVISWHAVSGRGIDGAVSFQPAGEDRTRITLDMSYEHESWTEQIGDLLGIVDRRVEGDLERFKEFIEGRGHETGAWRGAIHSAEVRDGHPVMPPPGEPEVEKTHIDVERERAEERQADPSAPGGAPGGNVDIDPTTGLPRRS
ncbi:MAG: SRPBCC family protein [Dehalococcoidia bacterium]